MITFYVAAAALMSLALLWLFHPLFTKKGVRQLSRKELNVAIYREDLAKLDLERSEGRLDAAEYERAHQDLRQRLHQDTLDPEELSVLHSSKKTMWVIGLCLPLFSVLIYFWLGSAQQISQVASRPAVTQQDVEKMITALAAKLEKHPEDLKGWAILARSYAVLGRSEDAEKAYEHAGSFVDTDPQLLADYADVAVNNAHGNFSGKPQALINQALKLDPNNLMALWLAGSAAFSNQHYRSAIQYWERLLVLLPPESDDVKVIRSSIAQARSKGNIPEEVPARSAAPKAMVGGKTIAGVVDLAPALKSKIKPNYIVMVIARAPGARMPVAIFQARAADLPVRFSLDDSLAMNPGALLSNLGEATVEARVSQSGQAMPVSGDLYSATQTVQVGSKSLRLLVDQVRP